MLATEIALLIRGSARSNRVRGNETAWVSFAWNQLQSGEGAALAAVLIREKPVNRPEVIRILKYGEVDF